MIAMTAMTIIMGTPKWKGLILLISLGTGQGRRDFVGLLLCPVSGAADKIAAILKTTGTNSEHS